MARGRLRGASSSEEIEQLNTCMEKVPFMHQEAVEDFLVLEVEVMWIIETIAHLKVNHFQPTLAGFNKVRMISEAGGVAVVQEEGQIG